jgi:ADP-heptose:LPS heptosyltransferase
MLNVVPNADELALGSGEYYFSGDGAIEPPSTLRLPVMAFRHGWHPIEQWGTWAARREAQLKFQTPFKHGAPVLVALRMHAPPGSEGANCVVRVGDAETPGEAIGSRSSWFFAEGVASYDGVLRVTILSAGQFGQPDSREIFVGLHSVGFCAADDAKARAAFLRKLKMSPADVARKAVSGLMTALRRSRDGGQKMNSTPRPTPMSVPSAAGPAPADLNARVAELKLAGSIDGLAPELAPRPKRDLFRHHSETIDLRQLGRGERTHWGHLRTLRGVESIRGYCISSTPIFEIQIILNGNLIYRGPLRGGYELKYELDKNIRKYVFNIWHDFSTFPYGRYEMELRFIDLEEGTRSRREQVAVAAPLDAEDYMSSDQIVHIPAGGEETIEQKVNGLPSMVRSANRTFFEIPIRSILVSRADQLGDMVCSVPGMRRLRELFPAARLVALLSAANEALARSLAVFDEIMVIDFPDDDDERRRIMPIDTQIALKAKLAPYKFDMALDLSESGVSRPLLLLSGARYKFGFRPDEFKWLSSGFEVQTHDRANALESIPHTTKLMGMVNWIGLLAASHATVVTRPDLRRDLLADLGLGAGHRYVVLHTGARLKFSRWPRYAQLAAMILERTDLKVVMLADDPDERARLDATLLASPRFQILEKKLSFDQFDALVSFCDAFVGNDSGPKHLASLRGANVVSIHLARNNWNEWGQENKGYIASRRVPCAGCSIHHEPEECGKDFACITNIRPEEIFDAVARMLDGAEPVKQLSSAI